MYISHIVLVGIDALEIHRVLEIRQQEQLLFQEFFLSSEVNSAVFNVGAACCGDISIRILQCCWDNSGSDATTLEFQICFHTCFVDKDCIRFHAHEIDRVNPERDCLVDVFFHTSDQSLVNDQAEDDGSTALCVQLQRKAIMCKELLTASPNNTQVNPAEQPLKSFATCEFLNAACSYRPASSAGGDARKTVFAADDVDSLFADL